MSQTNDAAQLLARKRSSALGNLDRLVNAVETTDREIARLERLLEDERVKREKLRFEYVEAYDTAMALIPEPERR